MKKITHVEKKHNTVTMTFDDQHVLHLEPEMIIKYKLLTLTMLDDATFLDLFDENEKLRALRFSFKSLKKMLTVQEMKIMLLHEGFTKRIIDHTICQLIERRYLDDLAYAKYYIQLKAYQQGPLMIAHKLGEKGISEHIIQTVFTHYDQNSYLYDIIEKMLKSSVKKSKKQTFQTIKINLTAKGFHQENIDQVLHTLSHLYQGDEQKLLSAHFDKFYKTLSKRYQGYELHAKIKEKLYQKGFNYEAIKAYLQSKDF